MAVNEAHTLLYAANDSAGTIDVFNKSFQPVSLGKNAFATPEAIAKRGLVPFNVTDIGGNVYVTYAPEGHTAQTEAGLGDGAVAVFNQKGQLEPFGVLLAVPTTRWPRRGASLSPRAIGAGSAATCWSAISATPIAKSMPSISGPDASKARSRFPPAPDSSRAASGT